MRHNTVELFFQPLIKPKDTREQPKEDEEARWETQLHDKVNHIHCACMTLIQELNSKEW